MLTPAHECIRCGDAVGVGAGTFCHPCLWVVRAEVEEGFGKLEEYLRQVARFDAWLREHGLLPPR
jgi:hypothetical protein